MLGVIVCSKCSTVQGADLKSAHVTCPRCGARIEVKRAKVYFSTESPKELAEAVRQVSEQMKYDIENPPEKPRKRIRVKKQKPKPEDEAAVRTALMKLQEKKEILSKADIGKALQIKDNIELDETISKMLLAGILCEVSPEEYKLVD